MEPGITEDLEELIAILPPHLQQAVHEIEEDYPLADLVELVLDLGRRPEARFRTGEVVLSEAEVTRDELHYIEQRLGAFGDDNRAGIERTLHRISAIRNRSGEIVGLTCRVGRAVFGTLAIVKDLIETGESILLLGRPGVGKTTMLREVARVLADDLRKRVVIVDTSNEIGGDGDIPHPSIGRARRMQVPTPNLQHAVMIEAVENHTPEAIVIDEIGTELEAAAARTIAERGVQLIGTAHGNTLENLLLNPTLSDLVGGIQAVTLSDEEARRRGTQKSVLERKAPPTFTIMVEIQERDRVAIIPQVAVAVDAQLRDQPVRREIRERNADGTVSTLESENDRRNPQIDQAQRTELEREVASRPQADTQPRNDVETRQDNPLARGRGTSDRPVRIFPFGVSRNRLEQAIGSLALPAVIVRDLKDADMVITLRNYYRQRPRPLRDAEARGLSIFVLRSNTVVQMANLLRDLIREVNNTDDLLHLNHAAREEPTRDDVTRALFETEEAINRVMNGAPPVQLTPQSNYIRRLQHELAERYNLGSRSTGRDPNRRVEIFKQRVAS
ncbi:MAG: R3H domain-containing nucleic acid-binding protein [Chloroflexota bacterium]